MFTTLNDLSYTPTIFIHSYAHLTTLNSKTMEQNSHKGTLLPAASLLI